MLKLNQAVIVEGKYDKIRLQSLIDAVILTTDGFRIFRDGEKLALIRAFAAHSGVVVVTDSDSAGMVIRRYLRQCVPAAQITHVYLPPVAGKEPRKAKPGAEGLLGAEGLSDELLLEAFARAGLTSAASDAPGAGWTKADFYRLGLTGAPGSATLRQALLARMRLPATLSANGLLEVVNRLYGREEWISILEEVRADGGTHRTEAASAAPD